MTGPSVVACGQGRMMVKARGEAGAFRLWVNTDGWTTEDVDLLCVALLKTATEYCGEDVAIELPLISWAEPAIQWAACDDERCRAVKDKPYHEPTSNPIRSAKGSSWRCGLMIGHDGQHRAPEAAHQSPWTD